MKKAIASSLKPLLERWPRLYLELVRFKRRGHWSRKWVVSRSTELVIEGFPRSANSFAKAAFLSVQPQRPDCATHVHSAAQIIQAVKWRIPTLVLLRDPVGAVRGDLAFSCELSGRDPATVSAAEIGASLTRYARFYEPLAPCQSGFLVGHFPEVTRDFGAVMWRFNEKFGTDYVIFEHTPESAAAIMDKSAHIGPQANRETIKTVIAERFNTLADPALVARARRAYEGLLEKS